MANNVSTGKPKVGGAVYVADTGTTLPTDAVTALAAGFSCLGYCSEDGVTNSTDIDSDVIKAWGGDAVLMLENGKEDTFQFTLIESLNPDVLSEVYGASNVSGSLAAGVSVTVNGDEHEARSWVIEMVMKNNVLKRVVIPNGVITEIGDIEYKDDSAVGYEVTVTALADNSGNYHYEYLKTST